MASKPSRQKKLRRLTKRASSKTGLLIGLCILIAITVFVWGWFYLQSLQSSKTSSTIQPITGKSLQSDFKKALTSVQINRYDKALLLDNFLLLDVRSVEEYDAKHIKGSLSAPASYLGKNIYGSSLEIVIYSTDQSELDQAKAALSLMGVKSIYLLTESLSELEGQGYTLTNTPT